MIYGEKGEAMEGTPDSEQIRGGDSSLRMTPGPVLLTAAGGEG